MAGITTYATLATALQDYLGRSNVGVASGNIDYFIQETEQELNSRLRVHRMLISVTPTISSAGVVTLPTDFGGWKRFVARQNNVEWNLELKNTEQQADVSRAYSTAGVPRVLLLSTTGLAKVFPYTDGVYTFTSIYFGRIPNLTSSATTNWVITNFPSAYLAGCLAAAYRYSQDEDGNAARADRWDARFRQVIKQIQAEDSLDLDAQTHREISPDTAMFTGRGRHDIQTDGQ